MAAVRTRTKAMRLSRDSGFISAALISRTSGPAASTVNTAGKAGLLISAAEMKPLALEGLIALVRVRTAATVMR